MVMWFPEFQCWRSTPYHYPSTTILKPLALPNVALTDLFVVVLLVFLASVSSNPVLPRVTEEANISNKRVITHFDLCWNFLFTF